jgi:hypothetical protein
MKAIEAASSRTLSALSTAPAIGTRNAPRRPRECWAPSPRPCRRAARPPPQRRASARQRDASPPSRADVAVEQRDRAPSTTAAARESERRQRSFSGLRARPASRAPAGAALESRGRARAAVAPYFPPCVLRGHLRSPRISNRGQARSLHAPLSIRGGGRRHSVAARNARSRRGNHGHRRYAALHRRSLADPEGFWASAPARSTGRGPGTACSTRRARRSTAGSPAASSTPATTRSTATSRAGRGEQAR